LWLARSRKRDAEQIECVQVLRMPLQLCGQRLDSGLKFLLFDVSEGALITRPRALSSLNGMAQEDTDAKRNSKVAHSTAHEAFS
jgi:hypothetical protein